MGRRARARDTRGLRHRDGDPVRGRRAPHLRRYVRGRRRRTVGEARRARHDGRGGRTLGRVVRGRPAARRVLRAVAPLRVRRGAHGRRRRRHATHARRAALVGHERGPHRLPPPVTAGGRGGAQVLSARRARQRRDGVRGSAPVRSRRHDDVRGLTGAAAGCRPGGARRRDGARRRRARVQAGRGARARVAPRRGGRCARPGRDVRRRRSEDRGAHRGRAPRGRAPRREFWLAPTHRRACRAHDDARQPRRALAGRRAAPARLVGGLANGVRAHGRGRPRPKPAGRAGAALLRCRVRPVHHRGIRRRGGAARAGGPRALRRARDGASVARGGARGQPAICSSAFPHSRGSRRR